MRNRSLETKEQVFCNTGMCLRHLIQLPEIFSSVASYTWFDGQVYPCLNQMFENVWRSLLFTFRLATNETNVS